MRSVRPFSNLQYFEAFIKLMKLMCDIFVTHIKKRLKKKKILKVETSIDPRNYLTFKI